jgi:hypothetical protein
VIKLCVRLSSFSPSLVMFKDLYRVQETDAHDNPANF